MTVYGYTRVSTVEQATSDRTSLETQARTIRGCAMMRGEDEPEIFSDPAVSGSDPFHTRPTGSKLTDMMVRGDVLIVSKMDRMFRSARDALNCAEAFRARGVNLVLCDMGAEPITNSGTSKIFFGILAIMAEFENDRRAERMAEGRKGKKARGGHIGGQAPYGYRVSGSGMDAMLTDYLPEQRTMQTIREMRAAGSSFSAIARALTDRGIMNRLGKPFAHPQIARILDRDEVELAA